MENEDSVPIYRFNRWGKAKAKGAIGKLRALKFIKKNKDKNFEATEGGLEFLDKILENIRQKRTDWLTDKITFLSIKFPENERGKRDKLRSYLKMASFMKIGGLWVVPEFDKKELIKVLKENKILDQVLLIEGKIENEEILGQLKNKYQEIERIVTR